MAGGGTCLCNAAQQRPDARSVVARGADIATTVTADKTNATILTREMIEPGMHINAVGGDCPGKTELHRGVLEASAVFVELHAEHKVPVLPVRRIAVAA